MDVQTGTVAADSSSSNHFLTRLVVSNFKSMESADISFGPLTFLVGPNGSGKSNVLDAIAFIADSLVRPLDHAMRDRGGINEVRRRSTGHPSNFGLRVEFSFPQVRGHYAFEIAARTGGRYVIKQEECAVVKSDGTHFFRAANGRVESTLVSHPKPASDRLYLVSVSGTPEFRDAFDALSSMRVYGLNPDQIRALQSPSAEPILTRDGSNITTIYGTIKANAPDLASTIEEYLTRVVPGIRSVGVKQLGPVESLEFRQDIEGATHPWRFLASNMSDGTLRAFGILVALFQLHGRSDILLPLIGVEEPEVSLHPAALSLILGALRTASKSRQIIVTSHSPDLLNDPELDTDSIRAVISERNSTSVVPLSPATREILRGGLYSAGELLRLNQLQPDAEAVKTQRREIPLFGSN